MKIQIWNKNLHRLAFFTQIILLPILASCTEVKLTDSVDVLGLYQVKSRTCEVPKRFTDDCEKVRFIELVKGQFYGVKNSEIALIIWRGDAGEELLYQAKKIGHDIIATSVKNRIIVTNTQSNSEQLKVRNGKVIEYDSVFKKSNKENGEVEMVYRFILTPVIRSNLPEFRMNYPGNK